MDSKLFIPPVSTFNSKRTATLIVDAQPALFAQSGLRGPQIDRFLGAINAVSQLTAFTYVLEAQGYRLTPNLLCSAVPNQILKHSSEPISKGPHAGPMMFKGQALKKILCSKGITSVFICGMGSNVGRAAEYCYFEGFKTAIIRDASMLPVSGRLQPIDPQMARRKFHLPLDKSVSVELGVQDLKNLQMASMAGSADYAAAVQDIVRRTNRDVRQSKKTVFDPLAV